MEHMGIPRESVRERAAPRQQNPNPLPEVPNARSALQARRPNRVQRNQGWAAYAFDWGFYLLLLPVTVPYRIASTAFAGCYSIVAYFFGLPALPGGLGGRRPPVGRDVYLYHSTVTLLWIGRQKVFQHTGIVSADIAETAIIKLSRTFLPPFPGRGRQRD